MDDHEAHKQSKRTDHDNDAVAEAAYRRGYQHGAAYVAELASRGLSIANIEKYADSTVSDWRHLTSLIPRRDAPDAK